MSTNVERAAAALREARLSRRQIAPIAATYGLGSIDEAYAVAELNTAARLAEGRRVVGRKIGLTAESVQRQLGVDQPDFGVLFDDMELLDRETAPSHLLMQPKVEAEIAFVIGRDLQGRGAPSWGEFVSAITYALPAIEIVDSAIADWKIGIVDTVADNASAGLYVMGEQPVWLGAFQLAAVEAVLRSNGKVVSQGQGSACLGHPLRAAYWLACEMARRGEGMRGQNHPVRRARADGSSQIRRPHRGGLRSLAVSRAGLPDWFRKQNGRREWCRTNNRGISMLPLSVLDRPVSPSRIFSGVAD